MSHTTYSHLRLIHKQRANHSIVSNEPAALVVVVGGFSHKMSLTTLQPLVPVFLVRVSMVLLPPSYLPFA